MYTYLKFLSQRYLGQKGQGIVEYAVIVAVVVAVGVALTTSSTSGGATFKSTVNELYSSIVTKVAGFKLQ